jgi:hypothetical protein
MYVFMYVDMYVCMYVLTSWLVARPERWVSGRYYSGSSCRLKWPAINEEQQRLDDPRRVQGVEGARL